jgi:hypothetical protein
MLKKVKSSILWLASWIVMPISVVWLLCQLLRHLPKYRWADHIFHDVLCGLQETLTPAFEDWLKVGYGSTPEDAPRVVQA